MLIIMKADNALPTTFVVDPSATFQPGMLAQLTTVGHQVIAGVSNGMSSIGIIDDVKTKAFTAVVWNEVICTVADAVCDNNPITAIDITCNLMHGHVLPNSFISTVDVLLNPVDGNITFPAGTKLNLDLLGTGRPNAIKTICNYTHEVAGVPGGDSTIGTDRMTVWINKGGIFQFQTDQFETQESYPINANLYCSELGLWTTRKPSPTHPCIGMVIGMNNGVLELITY